MWSVWIIISGLVILWAIELRYKELSGRITTMEIVIKELEDHVSDLRHKMKMQKEI